MKKVILMALIALGTKSALANTGTPVLHEIQTYSFGAPYSCPRVGPFNYDYSNSALFLSDASKAANAPELLFNSDGCSPGEAPQDFSLDVETVVGESSVIADLGATPLSSLNLVNLREAIRSAQKNGSTLLKDSVPAVAGHTYVVLNTVADGDGKIIGRALWALHVDKITKDGQMSIHYIVDSYSFNWR